MSIFSALFRRSSQPDLAGCKNEALVRWINTIPYEAKLQKYVGELPRACRREVEAAARAAYEAAGDFIEAAAARNKIDFDTFYPALEAHLKACFPWITETGIAPLRSYTGWYSWHEGY